MCINNNIFTPCFKIVTEFKICAIGGYNIISIIHQVTPFFSKNGNYSLFFNRLFDILTPSLNI